METTRRLMEFKISLMEMRESLQVGYNGELTQSKIDAIKNYLAENSFSNSPIFNFLKIKGGKLDYSFPIIKHYDRNDPHNQELKKKNVSISAFLDTARPRKDETLTIRLRVIYNKESKVYSTKVFVSEDDYIVIANSNPRNELRTYLNIIQEILERAYKIVTTLPTFIWGEFEKKLFDKYSAGNNVWNAFQKRIVSSTPGTASVANTALRSFQLYSSNKTLTFDDITVNWLKNYEQWMLKEGIQNKKEKRGASITTISINTRVLRALYNEAMEEGNAKREAYPFGNTKKKKYKPLKHNNNKRPLTKEQLKKIFEYNGTYRNQQFYKDMFVFSYLCYGLNSTDICRLKYSNIDSKYIEIIRKKTEHSRDTQTIRILLNEHTKRIIQQYGTGKKFVFPVLDDSMDEKTKYNQIKQFTHNWNDNLKSIDKKLWITMSKEEFEEKTRKKEDPKLKLSSMFARHSFVSISREAKIPESVIQQCIGHTDGFGVTNHYMNELTDSQLEEVNEAILDFNNDFIKLTEREKILIASLNDSQKKKVLKELGIKI